MKVAITLTTLALLAKFASARQAVIRFYGDGPLTVCRADPIVSPGVASSHVHVVNGGSNFALKMSDTTLQKSDCTSTDVQNDRSNYWAPTMFFHDVSNNSFESVGFDYMNIYYDFVTTSQPVKAFPEGLRMVVGNSNLRTPPVSGGRLITDTWNGTDQVLPQPVQWICPRNDDSAPLYPADSDGLHGVGIGDPTNGGAGVGFSDKVCDGLYSPTRADIYFPSCYNPQAGVDNYRNNMAYPNNTLCPDGWIHVPSLHMEIYWNTVDFADRWTPGRGSQPFVLANGDPTGYSLHADFISGWDVPTLQQIIDNCNVVDGGADICPGLMGGVNTADGVPSCHVQCPINEQVEGVLAKLPGSNPVGTWGINAGPADGGAVASSTAQSAFSTKSLAPVTLSTALVFTTQVSETAAVDSTTTSYKTSTTSVWTTSTAPSPYPSASTISSYAYAGCYSDTRSVRSLSAIKFPDLGRVTNTKCIVFCSSKNYAIAGTEYGGQCFCDDALKEGSVAIDEVKCNMACEGDASQICGGPDALSVWKKQ